jgi:hypothetical protein
MAKQKYKKKPEVYYAIQYDGTNNAEMTEFCPQCVYDTNQGKLIFNLMVVDPTMWIMSDNAGIFTIMMNDQFIAYFDLDQGPQQQPASV